MNKTKNEFIEYYKKVIEYLKNKKMEFCFGEDGQFLTLENCQKSIEFYKNK
jgi:isopropylmalate/homocitrate/citramalate synthase